MTYKRTCSQVCSLTAFYNIAANVLKSILRWHLVEGNVHIDIKTKFGYKQYRLKIVEEKVKVNDDKEVNST